MVKVIEGDLLTVDSGLIVHQVNCQGVMGAGVARALYSKYPEVKSEYLAFCKGKTPEELLGHIQLVRVSPKLTVANLFTQLDFGNGAVTGIRYTNEPLLVSKLVSLDDVFTSTGTPVYAPYKIGSGLANGNWGKIFSGIAKTNITLYKLPEAD